MKSKIQIAAIVLCLVSAVTIFGLSSSHKPAVVAPSTEYSCHTVNSQDHPPDCEK